MFATDTTFYEECSNTLTAFATGPTPTIIYVGPGDGSVRVAVSDVISCTQNEPGINPQNPNWPDTFHIHVANNGQHITVSRNDPGCEDGTCGWGQQLEVQCTAEGSMESFSQLYDSCLAIPPTDMLDMIDDLLGSCSDVIDLDCDATGCHGGLPLQCAAVANPVEGINDLAERISVDEELNTQGYCLESVAGGGWTFVNEEGYSTTDISDLFAEELGGYHESVYNTRGMAFDQVLVRRMSPTWCARCGIGRRICKP